MNILNTERLNIRRVSIEDAPFLFDLMNDQDWIANIGDRGIKTIEDAENYIKTRFLQTYEEKGFGFYALTLKFNQNFIGIAGLVDRDGLDDVDIGYGLLPQYRGKGYAYEAAKAVYNYGYDLLKLEKIVAVVNPDNNTSIKLLNKLGLTFEKMIRLPGEDKDIKLFS